MKYGRQLMRQLAETSNIVGTLNGGMSNPQIKSTRNDDAQNLEVIIPGVAMEDVKVEITNNVLGVVYYMEIKSNHLPMKIPYVAFSKPIPYFVDMNRIKATNIGNSLHIRLPFNRLADGFHREINIETDQ